MTGLPIIDDRPRSFDDCVARELGVHAPGGTRHNPCPFVSCSDHLAWMAVRVPNPAALSEAELADAVARLEHVNIEDLSVTCARRGPFSLAEIGALLDVSRQRACQLEAKALAKMRHPARSHGLRQHREDGHPVSRPDLYDSMEEAAAAVHDGRRAIDPAATHDGRVTAAGRTQSREEWARELEMNPKTLSSRASAHKRTFGAEVEALLRKRAKEERAAVTRAAEQHNHAHRGKAR